MMGRMGRQDQGDGVGLVPPHPMNQKGHHRSYTCMKSRAQLIRGEQQMLHLHDSSRTAPDELEFTSEPQRQSSSHRQQWEAGIKMPLPQPLSLPQVLHTCAAFSTDHPHHYRTLMRGTSGPPPRPQHPSKRGTAVSKATKGVLEAAISPCPRPSLLPPPNRSQEAETSPEENSSSRNCPPRSSFKWLSDPFKQI